MKHALRLVLMLCAGLAFDGPAVHSQTEPSHRELFPPQDLGLLEGPDRAAWQKPDQIMDALGIADGAHVADIGAGAGWFTTRLARRVGPNGVVYAQDVQRQMLDAIRRRVTREGLANVKTVLGKGSSPNLPPRALDAVLVVDSYQEVNAPDRVTFLRNLAAGLKPGGPHRHRQLQARGRRPRSRGLPARAARLGGKRRRRGRAEGEDRRQPPLPVPAGPRTVVRCAVYDRR